MLGQSAMSLKCKAGTNCWHWMIVKKQSVPADRGFQEGEVHQRVGTAEHWRMLGEVQIGGVNIFKNYFYMSIRLRAVCKDKDVCLLSSTIVCRRRCYFPQIDNFPLLPALSYVFSFVETKLCLWTAGSQVFAGSTMASKNLTMLTQSSGQWTVWRKELEMFLGCFNL